MKVDGLDHYINYKVWLKTRQWNITTAPTIGMVEQMREALCSKLWAKLAITSHFPPKKYEETKKLHALPWHATLQQNPTAIQYATGTFTAGSILYARSFWRHSVCPDRCIPDDIPTDSLLWKNATFAKEAFRFCFARKTSANAPSWTRPPIIKI